MVGDDNGKPGVASGIPASPHKALSPDARRALAEAEARRASRSTERPVEIDGRGGLEPVRYGDWEVKGLASDF